MPRQHRYEWEYLHGALEVVEGQSCFAFLPSVGLDLTALFLTQLAASDPQAEHVVVYDQAGFHLRPGDARVPARVHLVLLPPYSPELNPVEGVWDYAGRDLQPGVRDAGRAPGGGDGAVATVLGGAGPGVAAGASLAARSSKQFVQAHCAENH
ncbi:MAG: transposase [Verrucomicrobia bacterium]|nr:transposase [Verrucomicrobiota bacterium]